MMMQKYKQNNKEGQFCFFPNCYPKHHQLIQEDKSVRDDHRDHKSDKISLKRVISRPSVPTVPTLSTVPTAPPPPRPLTILHPPARHSLQALLSPKHSSRIMFAPTAITPKPRITFDWKTDLDRTKKAQTKNQPSVVVNTVDVELQKTKPVHRLLKVIPQKHLLNSYKASLISIQSFHSEQEKHPPKVEESLIMVDYFNPTKKQLQGLQSFLQKKEDLAHN